MGRSRAKRRVPIGDRYRYERSADGNWTLQRLRLWVNAHIGSSASIQMIERRGYLATPVIVSTPAVLATSDFLDFMRQHGRRMDIPIPAHRFAQNVDFAVAKLGADACFDTGPPPDYDKANGKSEDSRESTAAGNEGKEEAEMSDTAKSNEPDSLDGAAAKSDANSGLDEGTPATHGAISSDSAQEDDMDNNSQARWPNGGGESQDSRVVTDERDESGTSTPHQSVERKQRKPRAIKPTAQVVADADEVEWRPGGSLGRSRRWASAEAEARALLEAQRRANMHAENQEVVPEDEEDGDEGEAKGFDGQYRVNFENDFRFKEVPEDRIPKTDAQLSAQALASMSETMIGATNECWTPRFHGGKLVREIVTKRFSLARARRENFRKPLVLYSMDHSPSCTNLVNPTTEIALAVMKYGPSHIRQSVKILAHTNGCNAALIENSKDLQLWKRISKGVNHPYAPQTIVDIRKRYDIAAIVDVGDFDAHGSWYRYQHGMVRLIALHAFSTRSSNDDSANVYERCRNASMIYPIPREVRKRDQYMRREKAEAHIGFNQYTTAAIRAALHWLRANIRSGSITFPKGTRVTLKGKELLNARDFRKEYDSIW